MFITKTVANKKHGVVVDQLADAIQEIGVRIGKPLVVIGCADQAARAIDRPMNLEQVVLIEVEHWGISLFDQNLYLCPIFR